MHIKLLSAICFSLDQSKILSSGNGLKSSVSKLKHFYPAAGEQIFWECMQRVMWQMSEQMGHNVTRETRDYLDRLLKIALDPKNRKISRHRKEYRMLSEKERDRFHEAVKALKKDKV